MSSPSSRRWRLDPGVERLSEGRLLLGGEPPRLVRLSEEGARALEAALSSPGWEPSESEGALLSHLAAAGLLHEIPPPLTGRLPVTFVVPVRQPAPLLSALLEAIAGAGGGEIVVVDDASPDGGEATRRAADRMAEVVLRPSRGGPAAARNSASFDTDFVVFLDADTVLPREDPLGWLRGCLGHFDDPDLALVAPRIRSLPGGGLSAYEALESPLDLGSTPGLVGSFRRIGYVPAAALVVRAKAFSELGGFDGSLAYGEDVDLVRRIEETGWRARYEPSAIVWHRPRPALGELARQRFSYGTAAAELERRHPGTVPPFAASPSSSLYGLGLLTALTGVASRRRALSVIGLIGALGARQVAASKLGAKLAGAGCPEPRALSRSLVDRGGGGAASALLRAFRRSWWPLALPFAAWRPARRPMVVLIVGSSVAGRAGVIRSFVGKGATNSLLVALCRHLFVGVVDDASYSLGALYGCAGARSLRALAPRLIKPRPKDRSERRGPPA